MELQEYLRMLRRGWPTVVAATVLGVLIVVAYVVATPKQYESGTVLFVSAAAPATIDDLQQGANFSGTAVVTYAQIIDSTTVLAPVAAQMRPQRDAVQLVGMVSSRVREKTTLIDVVVTSTDPADAAAIANATAASASGVIAGLQRTPFGRPLVSVQQIRPAVEPAGPSSPNVKRLLAIAVVVGLFVGLGATIVRQSLDTRVRRVEELRRLSGVPVIALLPRRARIGPARRRGVHRTGLEVRDAPSSSAGEAFRLLSTNLGLLEVGDRRSLVLAPVADDEDAVLVPVNLALLLARTGWRVLIADLDLSRSAVGDALGVDAERGVADVLARRWELADAVQASEQPSLDVLPSGAFVPGSADLISSRPVGSLLRRLEQDYDIVIVHAAAMSSHADAAVIARVSTATVLSVKAGSTRADEVTAAMRVLSNVRVSPLGVVLTDAAPSSGPADGFEGHDRAMQPGAVVSQDAPTLQQHRAQPSPRPRQNGYPRMSESVVPPPRPA